MKENLASLWQKLFGDSVRAFGVVSIVFLVSIAIAPAKNFFSEWRHYQHGYLATDSQSQRCEYSATPFPRRHSANLATRPRSRRSLHELPRRFKRTQPNGCSSPALRPHPSIPHKLDQFGCTVCHRGQGAATTVAEAHNSTLAWEQPILPGKIH